METRVVHDATSREVEALYRTHEWFAENRSGNLDRALENTDEFVGLRAVESDELVASARVLTDYVYTAKVLDVIVEESLRGSGLGTELLEAVTGLPELRDVHEVTLTCRESVAPFYEACGFRVHDMMVDEGEDYYVMVRD